MLNQNQKMNSNQIINHNKMMNNNFMNQIIQVHNPKNKIININKNELGSIPNNKNFNSNFNQSNSKGEGKYLETYSTNINNEKIIPEKHIEGHPFSMSLYQMKFYSKQMEKSVSKIQKSPTVTGTGFLL